MCLLPSVTSSFFTGTLEWIIHLAPTMWRNALKLHQFNLQLMPTVGHMFFPYIHPLPSTRSSVTSVIQLDWQLEKEKVHFNLI